LVASKLLAKPRRLWAAPLTARRVATLAIASVIVVRATAPSAVLPVVAVTEPTPELGSGLSAAVETTLMGALCQAGVRIVFQS
jgi:hypothetical protein